MDAGRDVEVAVVDLQHRRLQPSQRSDPGSTQRVVASRCSEDEPAAATANSTVAIDMPRVSSAECATSVLPSSDGPPDSRHER